MFLKTHLNLLIIAFLATSFNFVASIESPKYDVVKSLGSNTEIRKYGATKWVGASVTGSMRDVTYNNAMFRKLFNYISGDNSARMKMEMTAPVEIEFVNSGSSAITPDTNVKMSMKFFVPANKQANTPNPTGDNMFLESNPGNVMAAIRFGGYAKMNDYLSKRDELIKILGDEAKNYDTANFKVLSYDSPYKFYNRRNEVCFKKLN